jgi:hypothetical protein
VADLSGPVAESKTVPKWGLAMPPQWRLMPQWVVCCAMCYCATQNDILDTEICKLQTINNVFLSPNLSQLIPNLSPTTTIAVRIPPFVRHPSRRLVPVASPCSRHHPLQPLLWLPATRSDRCRRIVVGVVS